MLTDCQLAFLLEGMILSVQIIDGDVLWAKMPDHAVLKVKVRAELVQTEQP